MSKWMLILIAGGGLIFLALTLTFTYEVVLLDYITMLVVVIFGTTLAYMTTVKFHSPMIVSENEKFNPTMFDSRAEVLDDREWGHQLGIVYWSGYNAPKRVFSKRDIETGGKASILITLSPFSGLPMTILTWILPVLGLVTVAIGVSYKRERMRLERPAPSHEEPVSASA